MRPCSAHFHDALQDAMGRSQPLPFLLGVDKQGQIGDKAAEFSKTFREELRKGMETLDRQQQGPKKGG